MVGDDRRLVDALPPEVPVGRVRLVIEPIEEVPTHSQQPLTREEVRRRLLAAGKLTTTPIAPNDAASLSNEERARLAQLFGGGPATTLDLINQKRGPEAIARCFNAGLNHHEAQRAGTRKLAC